MQALLSCVLILALFSSGHSRPRPHGDRPQELQPYDYSQLPIQPRSDSLVAIGIPTVSRDKGKVYVIRTVTSLLTNAASSNYNFIIVILLADDSSTERRKTRQLVEEQFAKEVQSGIILLFDAPDDRVPDDYQSVNIYKHEKDFVAWRQKQCLDYAYLINSAAPLAKYYLQLEDDVETVPKYLNFINDMIITADAARHGWMVVELSTHGIMGTLFPSKSAIQFAKFLNTYWAEHEIQHILFWWMALRGFVGYTTTSFRLIRAPSLFQHIGEIPSFSDPNYFFREEMLFSSDSVEQEKNRLITIEELGQSNGPSAKRYNVVNPPASFSTHLLSTYEGQVDLPYSQQPGHFWASEIQDGSIINFNFLKIQQIKKIVVETCFSIFGGRDCLERGVLESTSDMINWTTIATFRGGRAQAAFDVPILSKAVRIRSTFTQTSWLLLREVAIWTAA